MIKNAAQFNLTIWLSNSSATTTQTIEKRRQVESLIRLQSGEFAERYFHPVLGLLNHHYLDLDAGIAVLLRKVASKSSSPLSDSVLEKLLSVADKYQDSEYKEWSFALKLAPMLFPNSALCQKARDTFEFEAPLPHKVRQGWHRVLFAILSADTRTLTEIINEENIEENESELLLTAIRFLGFHIRAIKPDELEVVADILRTGSADSVRALFSKMPSPPWESWIDPILTALQRQEMSVRESILSYLMRHPFTEYGPVARQKLLAWFDFESESLSKAELLRLVGWSQTSENRETWDTTLYETLGVRIRETKRESLSGFLIGRPEFTKWVHRLRSDEIGYLFPLAMSSDIQITRELAKALRTCTNKNPDRVSIMLKLWDQCPDPQKVALAQGLAKGWFHHSPKDLQQIKGYLIEHLNQQNHEAVLTLSLIDGDFLKEVLIQGLRLKVKDDVYFTLFQRIKDSGVGDPIIALKQVLPLCPSESLPAMIEQFFDALQVNEPHFNDALKAVVFLANWLSSKIADTPNEVNFRKAMEVFRSKWTPFKTNLNQLGKKMLARSLSQVENGLHYKEALQKSASDSLNAVVNSPGAKIGTTGSDGKQTTSLAEQLTLNFQKRVREILSDKTLSQEQRDEKIKTQSQRFKDALRKLT